MIYTYLKNIRYGLLKIPELTRLGVDSRLSLIKNNFNKLFITTGRRYFLGSNSKIKGTGTIYVKDCLDIGITGLHNVYETDNTIISCDGELKVNGHASIGKGSRVYIANNASFSIGTNTYITGRATITVNKRVDIGDNCAIAWGLTLIDSDYHDLKTLENNQCSKSAPIIIGDNVWIGCNVTILKGASIAKGVVVAANAVVNKSIQEENVLVAGNPAKIVKHNITWQR